MRKIQPNAVSQEARIQQPSDSPKKSPQESGVRASKFDFENRSSDPLDLMKMFDLFPLGVILVDEVGQIVSMNRKAEEITRREDGLIAHRRDLRANRSTDTRKLRTLIARVCEAQADAQTRSSCALTLPRPSLMRDLSLLAAPVSSFSFSGKSSSPMAVIFVSDPEEEMEGSPELLSSLYDLTPAEARLAALLMEGISIREAADRLNASYETCRSQLKSIYSKTQTHRQSELLRLLLVSPAMLSLT